MAVQTGTKSGFLRIATYNLHGFKNSWSYLQHLLDSNDIVFVQELWLYNSELSMLEMLSDSFVVHAQSGMDNSVQKGIHVGRPYGGVAVFIRKSLFDSVQVCAKDVNGRVLCVKLTSGNFKMLLFGCYFPCDDGSTLYVNRLSDVVGFIESVVCDFPGFKVCVLGDLNFECHYSNTGYNTFRDFAVEFNLVACDDLVNIDSVNYTYQHVTLDHRSWLDHVFISADIKQLISDCTIIDCALNTSDHLPVAFHLHAPVDTPAGAHRLHKANIIRDYRWDKGNINGYYNDTRTLLSKINHEFYCSDCDDLCHDSSHQIDISIYYAEILFALTQAANNNIPKVPKSAMKHYWSVALDDLKNNSISTFKVWISAGKPRQGFIFEHMKDAKYKYKLAVRDAVRMYETKFSDELFEHMLSKDMNSFWKVWSKKTCKNVISVDHIDDKTDDLDIANVFKDSFNIFSACNDVFDKDLLSSTDRSFTRWELDVETIDNVIRNRMKSGKAAGYDNLTSDHILYSHPILVTHLRNIFNLMLKHSYVPDEFGKGVIVPLVKDKRGDLFSSSNYRGITVSPVISKIFELCLLDKFGNFLNSSDLQLGFKKNIGCGPGVFLVQNVVDYFVSRGSSVYVASIDASKAFDRVNHKVLFQKLISRGAPCCFIGILCNWYSKLFSCVRWNGVLSSPFHVKCGVRQGGILSPFLFNIYVDDLIDSLSVSGFGCYINKSFFGCIMYADDLLILSSSLSGLQHMLDLCSEYAKLHSLVYNVKKTCCTAIGKQRPVNARIFLEQQAVIWKDSFRYLGIDFKCNVNIEVDVAPVRKKFYAACNNIIAKSRGVMEPVAVQLVKSYCLPLLVYCIGALRLTSSAVRQLSVCWNDAFRKISHFKRFESIRSL